MFSFMPACSQHLAPTSYQPASSWEPGISLAFTDLAAYYVFDFCSIPSCSIRSWSLSAVLIPTLTLWSIDRFRPASALDATLGTINCYRDCIPQLCVLYPIIQFIALWAHLRDFSAYDFDYEMLARNMGHKVYVLNWLGFGVFSEKGLALYCMERYPNHV